MPKAYSKYKVILVFIILTAICQLISRMAVNFLPFVVNNNIAFGLAISNFYATLISISIFLFGVFVAHKQKHDSLIIALVLAGVASNIVDRLVFRGVIDYINLFGVSLANLADILIVGGLIVLGYRNVFSIKKARD